MFSFLLYINNSIMLKQKVNKSIFLYAFFFTKHFPMKCLFREYIWVSNYLGRVQKTSNSASELTSSSLKQNKYNILVNFDKFIEPAEKQIFIISSNFTPLIVYASEKTLTVSLCRNGQSEDVHHSRRKYAWIKSSHFIYSSFCLIWYTGYSCERNNSKHRVRPGLFKAI